jgi:hypothetical protein
MASEMLDTTFLFQPRGPGTAYLFRMATPPALIGQATDRPYDHGLEIEQYFKEQEKVAQWLQNNGYCSTARPLVIED